MKVQRRRVLKSPMQECRIFHTRVKRSERCENWNKRPMRMSRITPRKSKFSDCTFPIIKITKYGTIAAMSIIVVTLVKNFVRFGVQYTRRNSSNRKHEFRTSSMIHQWSYSCLDVCRDGNVCKHDEMTDRKTAEKDIEDTKAAVREVLGF